MTQTPPGPSFSELPLSPATLENLERLGYRSMTPIQAASLPLGLAGRDLIAQAKTGSGKTAAFGLVLLSKLDLRKASVQALVLCPTRELAEQVAQELRRLARTEENLKVLTLCGGTPARAQMTSLEYGAHVVVGTPGRLLDLIRRESLKLDALNTLVFDEADRMLDMGFFDDIVALARACPSARQTLLFSATYPERIAQLSSQFLREPEEVKLLEQHASTKIRQVFYKVEEERAPRRGGAVLDKHRPVSTLAFCNTREQCRDLLARSRRRVRGAGAARRARADRARPGAHPVRQPQLLRARRDRRRRARARHRPARSRDQRRHHARPRACTRTASAAPGASTQEGWAFSLASRREQAFVERIEESARRRSSSGRAFPRAAPAPALRSSRPWPRSKSSAAGARSCARATCWAP
jgi:ATP-independent RNA helicase DbpA